MPKRTDIQSVLVIGSGPIVIGQAAEFDYSGTQACRVLKAEGLRVILVNSNPATIMTDPEIADATYVEPITPEFVEKIIAKERPDALLPTLGGQTALNTAISMHEQGVLEKYGVELIGANVEAINKGEDRDLFKGVVEEVRKKIGHGESARSYICHSMDDVLKGVEELGGYPVVVRPSFTMGGAGSGFAHDEEELRRIAGQGLTLSPTTEVLLEESILGWKEYELELMRDKNDNVVVVCSIENFDPMGVHTGDSITVAPAMTLTDREYQILRDVGIAIIREVGVDTGGCNIQFAVNPEDGRVIVIEMNPRVSRSSALASKATGFPIAKIAAKLAVGYTLDEIPNDITEKTPASFEPTLDYVVVKAPRFAFEKFPSADSTLTTTMKSVGEAMAIGRNFPEALQKALRSLEKKGSQFTFVGEAGDKKQLLEEAVRPTDGRINSVMQAIRAGATREEVFDATKIDPWFVDQLFLIKEIADELAAADHLDADLLADAKRHGFSDVQIAEIRGLREDVVREVRQTLGVRPVYKTVDTCAAEFAAKTPYFYSSYDEESEVAAAREARGDHPGLGPEPHRPGHRVRLLLRPRLLRAERRGLRDRDGQLQPRDRLHGLRHLRPALLRAAHPGGRPGDRPRRGAGRADRGRRRPARRPDPARPLAGPQGQRRPDRRHLARGHPRRRGPRRLRPRARRGRPPRGRSTHRHDVRRGEGHRRRDRLPRPRPPVVRARRPRHGDRVRRGPPRHVHRGVDRDQPLAAGPRRPLPGRRDRDRRGRPLRRHRAVPRRRHGAHRGGRHPLRRLGVRAAPDHARRLRHQAPARLHGGHRQGRRRPRTDQHPVRHGGRHPVRPRSQPARLAHRPLHLEATAVPLAKAAARISLASTVAELRAEGVLPKHGDGGTLPMDAPISVKEAVMPWSRFRDIHGRGVDTVLGPEMRSTGEVMGIDSVFGTAYAKSQAGAYGPLPTKGRAFISVANRDKRSMIFPARELVAHGFELFATSGTAEVLKRNGLPATVVRKQSEGVGPNGEKTIVQLIHDGGVDLIVNTPYGTGGRLDGYEIRTAAVARSVPCLTTVQALAAAVQGIDALNRGDVGVRSLQEHAERLTAARD